MAQDYLGNGVTTGQPATAAAVDEFIKGFLGYETRALAIIPAADADPGSALANAYAAIFNLFLEAPAGVEAARPYLARAKTAAAGANRREQGMVAAAEAWVGNDIPRLTRVLEEVVADNPRDLAAAKLCQYHHFNLGDAPGMLRVAEAAFDSAKDVPHMHGLIAFAYEQCHLLEEAEEAARTAVAMQRKEPWAHHALAHVLLTEGRTDEGIAFLRDVAETWTDLNSFMVTHNWWHLCLFLMDRERFGEVLDLYDRQVWGVWKDYSQDQIGAVSLLMRLELLGVDVGDRWQDVGDHLAVRVDEHVQPFLDMQYLYGLARAGRPEADAMMASLERHAAGAPAFVRAAWQDVAVPACRGLLAHARGDKETTVRELGLALPRLTEIGGSHAQRDLFEQVLLDALMETGRWPAAQRMWELRRRANPGAPAAWRALEKIYANCGLPRESAAARAKVAALVA